MTDDSELVLGVEYATSVIVDTEGNVIITQGMDEPDPDVVILSPQRLSQIVEWIRAQGVKV